MDIDIFGLLVILLRALSPVITTGLMTGATAASGWVNGLPGAAKQAVVIVIGFAVAFLEGVTGMVEPGAVANQAIYNSGGALGLHYVRQN